MTPLFSRQAIGLIATGLIAIGLIAIGLIAIGLKETVNAIAQGNSAVTSVLSFLLKTCDVHS
jgi:hypothetical protein